MVAVSSIGTTTIAAPQSSSKDVASSSGPSSPAAATQSITSVTLAQSNRSINDQLYAADGSPLKPPPPVQVWEQISGDAVSAAMAINYATPSASLQFNGLAAALLDRFKNGTADTDNFSQSMVQFAAGSQPSAAVAAAAQSQLHIQADKQIALTIQTASGATVEVTLGAQRDGLAVQVQVKNGTLTDAERDALSDLSDGFQKAVDGIAKNPPAIDLAGLTKFDTNVLSSVKLHASVKINETDSQELDFYADSKTRTFSSSGPIGSMNVSVNLGNVAAVGSAKQQAAAIDQYLKQFDYERQRGHGDAELMSMFKSAFTGLNSNYPASATKPAANVGMDTISLTRLDRSVLTGLADFSASVSQNAEASNPMRLSEMDTFSYQISQNTSIKGGNQLNRSISQTQQSHLSASYHAPPSPNTPLALTTSAQSQNYTYHRIDDTASSTASISYHKGALVQALLIHSASQSERVQKYELGVLKDDSTTSSQHSKKEDFLKQFTSALQGDDDKTSLSSYAGQQALEAVNKLTVLQSDPDRLKGMSLAQELSAVIRSSAQADG